jgi:hypothetical protein
MARRLSFVLLVVWALPLLGAPLLAQLIDRTLAPNTSGDGIALSLTEQVGAGRGDGFLEDSSNFIIARDPFRSIRRGRQLFQRKFTVGGGQGPVKGDGSGDIDVDRIIGAGLSDSCASCHGRPRGSAGFGGDVVTRPDSRDAPHLFGLGLKEMLADEMTSELRAIRDQAIAAAVKQSRSIKLPLVAKGIRFGSITGLATGVADLSEVQGVDADLRIRPFFAHGDTISIREFIVGAFNAEMGLQIEDTDFNRHDLGPAFHEREYDGSVRQLFLTTPLWGVGSTSPYGHDGRSISLVEVILRHGGEAEAARNAFAALARSGQLEILAFLNSLILFPPDDTASNLDPGNRSAEGYPQYGHGSIRLTVLFNNPLKVE